MKFCRFDIAGPLLIEPLRHGDSRGWFVETFRADLFDLETPGQVFVQDNESLSERQGTVRGLHFQSDPYAQGKLVRCTSGALFDVAVDLRHGSATFGRWIAAELSMANGLQLWVPPGFAHGFCTLESRTVISYKVTNGYSPECDKGLAWDDPAIGISWPDLADRATLSTKDRAQPKLADLPAYFNLEA